MASSLKNEDECGIRGNTTTEFIELIELQALNARQLDLNTTEGRLQTFINWPPSHPIKPIDLAEAGFYSLGKKNVNM